LKPELSKNLEAFLADAPVFLQPWWLEAVAPSRWDYAVVLRGEEIAAAMPYTYKKWLGWSFIEGPAKTPFLGPWLRTSTAKYARQLAEQKDLLGELIDSLPKLGSFSQAFHPGITNWLPFYWRGFQQSTRYTYRFEDTANLEAVWQETTESVRTDIKKARKILKVEACHDFQSVIDLHKKTWQRQGRAFAQSDAEMMALHDACLRHECCQTFIARDTGGRPHAAAYFIWDKSAVYYYTSGADPALRNSGAGALLVWQGIELASKLGLSFDFEGSMHEPIERFFRSFGGCQVPYFVLSKTSSSPLPAVISLLRRTKGLLKTLFKNGYFNTHA
jgi:hypothetical protein